MDAPSPAHFYQQTHCCSKRVVNGAPRSGSQALSTVHPSATSVTFQCPLSAVPPGAHRASLSTSSSP
ncbi:hypothetical protein PENSPDRAFT_185457 [Peniophora sp. CONT]|nr:hypothetical protein PENSPDRAFT_185457 [Peniophora sp. CONT]